MDDETVMVGKDENSELRKKRDSQTVNRLFSNTPEEKKSLRPLVKIQRWAVRKRQNTP